MAEVKSAISSSIYKQFMAWMKQNYPFQYALYGMTGRFPARPNEQFLRGNEYFQYFASQQGLTEYQAPVSPYTKWQPAPTEGVMYDQPASPDEGETLPAKYGGYSPEEWGFGVPGYELDKRRLELQQQQWRDQQTQRSWEQLNEADRARWLAQGEAAQLENTRLMSRLRGDRSFEEEQAYQAKLAKDFEDMRAMFAGSPRNWIQASLPNPYQSREMTADEQLYKSQTDQEQANEILKQAQQLEKMAASDPNISLTPEQSNSISIAKQNWSAVTDRNIKLNVARQAGMQGQSVPDTGIGESEQIEAGKWATPRPTAEGFEVGRPTSPDELTKGLMPKIPDWLAQATGVSGRVPKAGTRVPIQTPSGASWGALSPTQQSVWGGLVDWSGQRTEADILTAMQSMIPQAPSLGRSWRATQQRV